MSAKELPTEGKEIIQGLQNCRDEIKALKAIEDDLKTQLLHVLDGAEEGTVGGKPVVRVYAQYRESFDIKRARQNPVYADMIARYTVASAYNSVRLV